MGPDFACAVAVLAVIWAVSVPPARIALRAVLRAVAGPGARRMAPAVQVGLGAGAVLAVAVAYWAWGAVAALAVPVALLLALMAAMDLAWRWLPHEWTGAFLALGLLSAAMDGRIGNAVAGAVLGAGILIMLRLWWRWRHDVEAIGMGDVVLSLGLGAFCGADIVAWVLLGAALTGLFAEGLRRIGVGTAPANGNGVAFGAHLCFVFGIIAMGSLAI